jgi:putative ABC transport system permease protein
LKNGIMGNFEGFATNSVFIWSDRTSEPYKGFNKGRYWEMRTRDLNSVREVVQGIEAISPMLGGSRTDKNVVYGQMTGTYSVKGVTPEYFRIESLNMLYGRLLNEIDIREKRRVCLIGSKIHEAIFKNEDPCGKYIRVNGLYYQIVGVGKPKSSSVNINGRSDESVFIPFSTLQQSFNQGDVIHLLAVSILPGYPVNRVVDDIAVVLKQQNEISPTDPQAIGMANLAAQFATFTMLFTGIDLLVWLVGMGTLLAGVIGISNIMMVTVKERTKEIGVRRALGAKPANIISQVMSESLLLTAIAGLLGLSLGVFILDGVNRLLTVSVETSASESGTFFANPEVSIQTAIAASIVIFVCGLLAGLIPAWRATQIQAIDAIREE